MRTTMAFALAGLCGAGLMLGIGCSDDEETTTPTTTVTTTTTTSANGGAGGGAPTGGAGGGSCHPCSELVLQNLPPTQACAGESTTLITALVTCLCAECGQPGATGGAGGAAGGAGGAAGGAGGAATAGPCFDACANGVTPDAACLACDQQVSAAGQPCETVMADCLADS